MLDLSHRLRGRNLRLETDRRTFNPFFDILSNFRCFGILHVLFFQCQFWVASCISSQGVCYSILDPSIEYIYIYIFWPLFSLEKTCYSPWSRENIHQLTVVGKITCEILRQKATYQTQRELYDLKWFTREYLNHKVFEETREIWWDW